MSGFEPIAAAALLAGTGTQIVGRQMAAREQSYAASVEQQQYERQAEQTRLAAVQDEAQRREELVSSLETIQAMRAGRGLSLTSPTGRAIVGEAIEDSERDVGISKMNYAAREQQARTAAALSGRRRRTSLLAGDIASVGDIAQSGSRLASIYR